MKSTILSVFALALVFSFTSCAPKKNKEVTTDLVDITSTASGNAPAGKAPVMKFEVEEHDFGTISQGERVSFPFKFRNVGGSDLIISEAHGSCGCTVPDYPTKPIAPGQDAVVNVEFNSEGKRGKQEKTVTMTTNCEPNTQVITIHANVVVPADRGGDSK
ncbi:MAG TPA: DUF1573 domain-containing protein [Bacteroidia bacterium]|nr:DUF1573 domain-containing protein [Bacteroidia bacterium]